jgi:hypothetical protein
VRIPPKVLVILQENHLPSTKDIANEDRDNGTEEASNIVTGDRDSLNGRDVVIIGMSHDINLWERSNEAAKREETSHHTLIITKEKEVDT